MSGQRRGASSQPYQCNRNGRHQATGPVPGFRRLLNLFMRVVFAAERAELLHFETLRGRLLVLHARIVLPFALGALKCNLFARHIFISLLAHNVCAVRYSLTMCALFAAYFTR